MRRLPTGRWFGSLPFRGHTERCRKADRDAPAKSFRPADRPDGLWTPDRSPLPIMLKPKIAFLLLALMSVAAVAFACFYGVMAGVFMHDSNFQTFQETLSEGQQRGILGSLRSVTTVYTWLLAITNGLWLAGAWYLLSKLRGRSN